MNVFTPVQIASQPNAAPPPDVLDAPELHAQLESVREAQRLGRPHSALEQLAQRMLDVASQHADDWASQLKADHDEAAAAYMHALGAAAAARARLDSISGAQTWLEQFRRGGALYRTVSPPAPPFPAGHTVAQVLEKLLEAASTGSAWTAIREHRDRLRETVGMPEMTSRIDEAAAHVHATLLPGLWPQARQLLADGVAVAYESEHLRPLRDQALAHLGRALPR